MSSPLLCSSPEREIPKILVTKAQCPVSKIRYQLVLCPLLCSSASKIKITGLELQCLYSKSISQPPSINFRLNRPCSLSLGTSTNSGHQRTAEPKCKCPLVFLKTSTMAGHVLSFLLCFSSSDTKRLWGRSAISPLTLKNATMVTHIFSSGPKTRQIPSHVPCLSKILFY